MAESTATRDRSLIAAGLGAVGASICCVGTFVLLILGVNGAWIGNLTALEPFRPVFRPGRPLQPSILARPNAGVPIQATSHAGYPSMIH